MKWYRLYSESLDDPKVQLLPAETFKGWINLLSIVNETEPTRGKNSGYLPKRLEDTAYKLHMSVQDTDQLITDLVDAGLFEGQPGRYRAHKWPKRQPVSDDISARVSKSRSRRTGNGKETLHAPNKDRTSTAPEERRGRSRSDKKKSEITDPETEAEEEASRDERELLSRRLRRFGLQGTEALVHDAISASGAECVHHCLDEAERHNKFSWVYVDRIRRRHLAEGCGDPDLLTRAERIAGASWN